MQVDQKIVLMQTRGTSTSKNWTLLKVTSTKA